MEEIAIGVVYPITKEKTTKYKQLISDPLIQNDQMKGMRKELRRVSKGYGETGTDKYVKGANTILVVDLDKIKTISRDQVVTYAQIVVDHRKKGPNLCENNCREKPNKTPL